MKLPSILSILSIGLLLINYITPLGSFYQPINLSDLKYNKLDTSLIEKNNNISR